MMENEFNPLKNHKSMSFGAPTPSRLEWEQHLLIMRVVEVFSSPDKAYTWLSRNVELYQTLKGLEELNEKLTQIDEGYLA